MSEKTLTPIEIGLTAAIVALEGNEPLILTASSSDNSRLAGLPFGPFDAVAHRTFEIGLRAWVEEQAGLRLDKGVGVDAYHRVSGLSERARKR